MRALERDLKRSKARSICASHGFRAFIYALLGLALDIAFHRSPSSPDIAVLAFSLLPRRSLRQTPELPEWKRRLFSSNHTP